MGQKEHTLYKENHEKEYKNGSVPSAILGIRLGKQNAVFPPYLLPSPPGLLQADCSYPYSCSSVPISPRPPPCSGPRTPASAFASGARASSISLYHCRR